MLVGENSSRERRESEHRMIGSIAGGNSYALRFPDSLWAVVSVPFHSTLEWSHKCPQKWLTGGRDGLTKYPLPWRRQ